MKETEKIKASEISIKIGRELYGEEFNLEDKETFDVYKKVFEGLFSSLKGKRKKGFLIVGSIGTGKSALFRVMQRMFKDTNQKFRWVKASELKDLAEVYTAIEIKDMYGYKLKSDLYIDDIGIAIDVKRYGNVINIISEIIYERYDLFTNSGFKTHLSSNLPPIKKPDRDIPSIESVFGKRIIDRLNEMCNVIVFKGNSKRK